MRADLPSGTVTFLFTDVAGSTHLLHSLGAEAYADELAEHRRLIREACAGQEGVEVDTQGDAFFFAFPSAPGALWAAREMTDALSAGPIQVRIGLHTGTPHLTSEGYVGEDVHRAARIAAAGHGGQVLVSEETRSGLEEGVALISLGAHRLKDFEGPVTIYQLGEGSFPALKTIANTNLPTPASSFLGREAELVQADALLSETRLLTIHGPGGQGKTRFALELARRAREERFSDYEDGVFSCFLASLRDPALVLSTICQTLSLREEAGRSALETLVSQLEGKRMLLLLDNLEHLLGSARGLSELLSSCPGLTFLATSRELLRIDGELPYGLPPLADEESISLFCERARAEPAEPIRVLCARLEGLPLAIELAAARMTLLTPEQLLDRLSQRLDLLKGGRDADPRQQTLRATIEWSYDLLSPAEQELFARLSVFAGGCTYEDAEVVAGTDPDTLQSLLEKSLLRRRDTDLGPRYWMLETIREYAAEQLDVRGEAAALQPRFRRHFLALTEQAEPELWGGQDEAWRARLDSENENLRAALGSAIADRDTEVALRLAVSIYRFWEIRSRYGEARDWLLQTLALDGGTDALRAKALMGVGRVAGIQCDWNEAIRCLGRSADSFRELHDPVGVSRCLGFLGHAYLFTGDLARAVDVLEENISVARQTGDVRTIANALYNGAFAYVERRDFVYARQLLEEARGVHETLHNKYGLAGVAIQLGSAATLAGDYERAAIELATGLKEAEEIGSPMWSFIARRHLAQLALLEGRTDEAEHLLVSLFRGRRAEVAAWEVAHWLNDLAAVAAAKADAPRAARLWGAADGAYEALGLALLEQNRLLRDRFMPRAREVLDQASWHATWTEGHEMSVAEAIAYALEQESVPS